VLSGIEELQDLLYRDRATGGRQRRRAVSAEALPAGGRLRLLTGDDTLLDSVRDMA
jgi:hypothetical protein